MGADSRAAFQAAFQAAVRAGMDRFAPRGLEYLAFLVMAIAGKGAGPGAPSRDIPPADLCRVFRDRASADFGRLAPRVLSRWGLASGGDLGKAIFLLAEKSCFSLNNGETWEEYAAAGEFRFP